VCVLPQKGQKAITVPDRVYEKLQAIANEKEDSIAGLVTKLADHVDFLFLVKTIDEEHIKEVLLQAFYTIEAIIEYINKVCDLKSEQSKWLIQKEEVFTVGWFLKNLPDNKGILIFKLTDQVERLKSLIPELEAEKEKLNRILYKITPEKIASERIIPLPQLIRVPTLDIKGIKKDAFWESFAKYFLTRTEDYFGTNFSKIKKVIDDLIILRDRGFSLEWTIDVLNRAYQELLKFKEIFGIKTLFEEDSAAWIQRLLQGPPDSEKLNQP
jgi:predicted CopG family antitoxin